MKHLLQENRLPIIVRSSFKSFATPWMDATHMVPSYLPFSLQEEVHAMDVKHVEETHSCLEKEKTHQREVSLVSTFRIPFPLLEYELFPRGRESHVLKSVFECRTRYSCMHQSSLAQYMSCGMHLVHNMIFMSIHVCYIDPCITTHVHRPRKKSGIMCACLYNTHVWT